MSFWLVKIKVAFPEASREPMGPGDEVAVDVPGLMTRAVAYDPLDHACPSGASVTEMETVVWFVARVGAAKRKVSSRRNGRSFFIGGGNGYRYED